MEWDFTKLVEDFSLDRNSRIYSHICSVLQLDKLPSQMSLKSASAVTDTDKANLFNRYFFSVYPSNSSSLPNVSSIPCPSTIISDIDLSPLDVYNAPLISIPPNQWVSMVRDLKFLSSVHVLSISPSIICSKPH